MNPKGDSHGFSSVETISGLPLWLEVKRNIYSYWVDANYLLYLIDKKRVQVSDWDDKSLGSSGDAFRSAVLRLYRACRPKLRYHKDKESVKHLVAADLDKYFLNPHSFSLADAMECFCWLTDFLEYDGITYFEDKRVDPKHVMVAELE